MRVGTPQGCHPMACIYNVSIPLVFFDLAPLGGVRHCLQYPFLEACEYFDIGAKCSSQVTSLFGNADLKAFTGASRQWHCRQRPTPLAVRSRSDNIKLLQRMKVPTS